MPAVEVRGVRLHYEVQGRGDPVVLSHGFLDSCCIWKGLAEKLAENHTVVAYDHRGHGRSDKPRGDYSVGSLAEDLRCLIESLHLGRVGVVGHSLGGMTALTLALEHPGMVSRLALVCTTARLVPQVQLAGRVMAGMGYLVPYRVFAERVMKLKVLGPSREPGHSAADRVTQTPKHVAYECGRGMLLGYDLTRSVCRVQAPTLILAGERDMGAPVAMSRFLHREIAGSRLQVLRGCGHVPMIEKPREFTRILVDFLS